MSGGSDEGSPPGNFEILHSLKCTSVRISIVVETPECLTDPASGFMLYTPTKRRQF